MATLCQCFAGLLTYSVEIWKPLHFLDIIRIAEYIPKAHISHAARELRETLCNPQLTGDLEDSYLGIRLFGNSPKLLWGTPSQSLTFACCKGRSALCSTGQVSPEHTILLSLGPRITRLCCRLKPLAPIFSCTDVETPQITGDLQSHLLFQTRQWMKASKAREAAEPQSQACALSMAGQKLAHARWEWLLCYPSSF